MQQIIRQRKLADYCFLPHGSVIITSEMSKEHHVQIINVDRGISLHRNWYNVEKVFSHLVAGSDKKREICTEDTMTKAMDFVNTSQSDNPTWEGSRGHFNLVESGVKINLFTNNKRPHVVEIYDNEEQESEIAAKVGLERASFAKYLFINIANDDHVRRINFKDVVEKLNPIIDPSLSEVRMMTHFQKERYYSPYVLGKADGFTVSLSLAGVSEERSIENDSTMRFDSCDKKYPASLSIEIIEGEWTERLDKDKILHVVDPEKKQKMQTLAQSLAQAFSPSQFGPIA